MTDLHKITIRLTPNAKQNAIIAWDKDAFGEPILKVQVTAVPEKGKANKALITLLSKEWGVPKSAFTLTHGLTSRTKHLEVITDKLIFNP